MHSETDYGFRREDEHGEQQHSEGPLAKSIEQQTAKLPSDTFMWAALGSMGASLILAVAGKGKAATFVGQWVPTLLIVGVYNKLVKLHGSDGTASTT